MAPTRCSWQCSKTSAIEGGVSGLSAGPRMLTVLVLQTLSMTPYRQPPTCYVLTRMEWS
jgi:hypothetical protein